MYSHNGCGGECGNGLSGYYGGSFYRAPGLAAHRGLGIPIPYGTIIGAGVDVVRALTSGSSSCSGQDPAAVVQAKLSNASPAQRAELVAALAGTKPNWFGGTFDELYGKADQLAFAVAGGSDCKVGTSTGERLVRAYRSLTLPPAVTTPAVPSTGGGYSPPTYAPVFDPGPPVVSTTTGLPPASVPDAGPSIWDQIKDAVGDAARAAAEAATRSVGTTVATIPAVDRQIDLIEHERRSAAMGSILPWAIGGAALLLVLTTGGGGRRRR